MERFGGIVEVDAPLERVFELLSDFESYPRWMGNVRGVWRVGRRTTHWVVGTALELDVEWDAEVTVFEPDRRLVWRAVRGDVHADGEFVLAETPRGTTLVRLVLGYDTPAGRTGRSAARFFGRHPRRQLEEDLASFKRFAERAGGRRARDDREEFGRRREGARAGGRARRFEGGGDERARVAPRGGWRREEARPSYAMTPRERERERELSRAEEEHRQRLRAGWYLRRGVDRLLDEPPPQRRRT